MSARNAAASDSRSLLRSEYTFANFVVGASNRVAYEASRAVAGRERGCGNTLLAICGGVAVGKTHLVQAIGHEMSRRAAPPHCLAAWTLARHLAGELRRDGEGALWSRLARADTLIVEDLDVLRDSPHIQERLLAGLASAQQRGQQVVVTAGGIPATLARGNNALWRYLRSGMVATIAPPDFALRLAVLRQTAAEVGIAVPEEVLRFIARRIDTNCRTLKGAFARLRAQVALRGRAPTLQLARRALEPFLIATPPRRTRRPVARAATPRSARPIRPRAPGKAGDLSQGLAELNEFIADIGGGRIGPPERRGSIVCVPMIARDGERYVLRIRVTEYLTRPPHCAFVDERGRSTPEAWPHPDGAGPFRSPSFICTPPTAEFYEVHPERVYRHGEGSLVNTVGTIFAALQAAQYRGRLRPHRRVRGEVARG